MKKEILLVDDDPIILDMLSGMLADIARTHVATDARSAMDCARVARPDLILLDVDMPGINGFDLCRVLKSDEELTDVPVIFLTAHGGEDFEVKAFACGAQDFVAKPTSEVVLKARVSTHLQLRGLAVDLRAQAMSDSLTGLANRRHFEASLAREWKRAARHNDPVSLLMIDVDHFKSYNDRYGHPAGDACLSRIAAALAQAVRRPCDLVARIGGEEFATLLPDTDRSGAICVAREMADAVAALALPHAASSGRSCVTVSIGVAGCEAASPDGGQISIANPEPGDLVARADSALYDAKRGGRACIRTSQAIRWPASKLCSPAATRARPTGHDPVWHFLQTASSRN